MLGLVRTRAPALKLLPYISVLCVPPPCWLDVDGSGSALMEEAEGSEILLNPPPPFTMMRPGVSLARDQGASS